MNRYLLIRQQEDDSISVVTNCTTSYFKAIFSNGKYEPDNSDTREAWRFLRDTLRDFGNLLMTLDMLNMDIKQVVKCDPKELIVLFE